MDERQPAVGEKVFLENKEKVKMIRIRKITSVLLIMMLVLAMALTGCAKKEEPKEEPAEEAAEEATEEEAAEEEAEEATEEAEEAATPEPGAVMTYEEYVAAPLDSEVTVETYVQAKQSWWEDKATIYTQAEDGAYFLYSMACSQEDYDKLVEGQKIKVTGYKAEWAGEVEIIDAVFEIIDGNFVAEAIDVTDLLGKDELIDHQNQKVAFKGLTVEASKDADGNEAAFLYNWDGSGEEGSDLYFTVSDGNNSYTFTVESYLCDASTDVYKAVQALEVGQTVDMEGFLYWYEGVNPHITSLTVAG